jgi:hypothetical protein
VPVDLDAVSRVRLLDAEGHVGLEAWPPVDGGGPLTAERYDRRLAEATWKLLTRAIPRSRLRLPPSR